MSETHTYRCQCYCMAFPWPPVIQLFMLAPTSMYAPSLEPMIPDLQLHMYTEHAHSQCDRCVHTCNTCSVEHTDVWLMLYGCYVHMYVYVYVYIQNVYCVCAVILGSNTKYMHRLFMLSKMFANTCTYIWTFHTIHKVICALKLRVNKLHNISRIHTNTYVVHVQV